MNHTCTFWDFGPIPLQCHNVSTSAAVNSTTTADVPVHNEDAANIGEWALLIAGLTYLAIVICISAYAIKNNQSRKLPKPDIEMHDVHADTDELLYAAE